MKYISGGSVMTADSASIRRLNGEGNDTNHLSESGKFRPLLGLYRALAQHLRCA